MNWWSDPSDVRWWGSLLASFAVSASVTLFSIHYARRRDLLDLPGQRRSHTQPTPRGGGIGVVVAALVFFCAPFTLAPDWSNRAYGLGVALALALVAAVGWIDDHRPLSARVRIVVHFAAAISMLSFVLVGDMVTLPWFSNGVTFAQFCLAALFVLVLSVIVVWSINLHNFMDGINGLLACQAIFVFAVLGASTRMPAHAWSMWILAAAALGFLPFNFPRAKVFMGDVGSGALGLLIITAIGLTLNTVRPPLIFAVLATSAFVVDATCTLLSRMLRGRRWYSAHREHLYQWMARSGMSHARVVAWYMGWNLLIVVPVLWWARPHRWLWLSWMQPQSVNDGLNAVVSFGDPASDAAFLREGYVWPEVALVYAAAITLWIFGKRWCLHKVKSRRSRHAPA